MKVGNMEVFGLVLLCLWLVLVGLTWATVITASGTFLGWFAVVVAAVILIETFLYRGSPRYIGRSHPQ